MQIYSAISPIIKTYPAIVPEGADSTYPYALYHVIASEPINTLDGTTGHEIVRMQIDIYHDDYDALIEIIGTCIGALNSVRAEYLGQNILLDDGVWRAVIECRLSATYY